MSIDSVKEILGPWLFWDIRTDKYRVISPALNKKLEESEFNADPYIIIASLEQLKSEVVALIDAKIAALNTDRGV